MHKHNKRKNEPRTRKLEIQTGKGLCGTDKLVLKRRSVYTKHHINHVNNDGL